MTLIDGLGIERTGTRFDLVVQYAPDEDSDGGSNRFPLDADNLDEAAVLIKDRVDAWIKSGDFGLTLQARADLNEICTKVVALAA